ncbi:STAS domain-containing protein [Methylophaga sp. OBS3]|uniref:STAS domain-containing protein n=1 Tax=Methylophaga sp. OBS3 TaxID=2991934 RepID=UPI002259F910|nr:STAS domain-containing protein [Methylophaga sp. OBS3]MCX4188856.1 STAS domain-containing protein [Methylophaga sp. OBS3]
MTDMKTMSLGRELTVAQVAELYIKSLQLLSEDGGLEIEMSDLQVVDAAGVQFLLALSLTAQESGLQLRMSSPSPALIETVDVLGLRSELAQIIHVDN